MFSYKIDFFYSENIFSEIYIFSKKKMVICVDIESIADSKYMYDCIVDFIHQFRQDYSQGLVLYNDNRKAYKQGESTYGLSLTYEVGNPSEFANLLRQFILVAFNEIGTNDIELEFFEECEPNFGSLLVSIVHK